jgi:hypothetical protein
MWWVTLVIELAKLLIPLIKKIKKDPEPNPVATKQVIQDLKAYVKDAPRERHRI